MNRLLTLILLITAVPALPAAAQEMPDFALGKSYKGVAEHWDGSTFTIELEFPASHKGKTHGVVKYPSRGCQGKLTPLKIEAGLVTFKERLTRGKKNCTDGGFFEFAYDPISMEHSYTYAQTHKIQPVAARGLLFANSTNTEEQMLDFMRAYGGMKRETTILGSWEQVTPTGGRDGWGPRCDQPMDTTSIDRAPENARGVLTVFATSGPKEESAVYAMYAKNKGFTDYETIVTKLRYFQRTAFSARDGLLFEDGMTYLSVGKARGTGRQVLVMAPKGGNDFDETYFARCE